MKRLNFFRKKAAFCDKSLNDCVISFIIMTPSELEAYIALCADMGIEYDIQDFSSTEIDGVTTYFEQKQINIKELSSVGDIQTYENIMDLEQQLRAAYSRDDDDDDCEEAEENEEFENADDDGEGQQWDSADDDTCSSIEQDEDNELDASGWFFSSSHDILI